MKLKLLAAETELCAAQLELGTLQVGNNLLKEKNAGMEDRIECASNEYAKITKRQNKDPASMWYLVTEISNTLKLKLDDQLLLHIVINASQPSKRMLISRYMLSYLGQPHLAKPVIYMTQNRLKYALEHICLMDG